MLVAGLALGLTAFSLQYALRDLVAAPGSLPAGRAFAWLSNWTWVIPFAMLAFLFLLSRLGGCTRGGGARPRGSWARCSWQPWWT